MNLGVFSGRLGNEPESRNMPNGDPVLNFPLAVDIGTRDAPKTMWLDCSIFGKRAGSLGQILRKGMKVTVSGRLTTDAYTNKAGQERQSLRLSVNELDLPPRDKSADGAPPASSGAVPEQTRGGPAWSGRPGALDNVPPLVDDDIPF